MRRAFAIVACTAAAISLGSGLAGARTRHRHRGTKLELRSTSKGTILVNSRGFTLYAFSNDTRNHDACQHMLGCTSVWPPLTTRGKPVAGRGVKRALIGTIRLRDGSKQVTYNGHPLYRYVGDKHPGETSYVGVTDGWGTWPALDAGGDEVS